VSTPHLGKVAGLAAAVAVWLGVAHVLAGDVAAFARSPQGFLFLVGGVAQTTVEALGLRITGDTLRNPDPGAPLIFLAFAGAGYGLAVWTPGVAPGEWGLVAAGLVVYTAGIVLRAWAQQTLGERFTAHVTADEEADIVEAGPYRHVRHPSYLALLLVFPSAPLILGSPAGAVVGLVGFLPFLYLRTRHEEDRLREAYGEAYEAYAERTPALVPRLL
jgi:protein-S-isoprenylcysteine O-methyltransferase Ste14